MKIIIYLAFIVLSPINTLFAWQIKLDTSESSIQIALVNTSDIERHIYKRLFYGPEASDSSIYLVIKNDADVHFDYISDMKIHNLYDPPEAFGAVQPNKAIKISVKMQDIVRDFQLKSGNYTIQAVYRNYAYAPKVFIGTLTSNDLNVAIRSETEKRKAKSGGNEAKEVKTFFVTFPSRKGPEDGVRQHEKRK